MEVVSEEVEVGGGWVEVVVDRDSEAAEVGPAVGGRDVSPGGRHLPQGLRHRQRVLVTGSQAAAATAHGPHDGEDDEEGQEDALDDDQLPGGVDVGPSQLLALPVQPVSVQHLPERVQVQVPPAAGQKRLQSGGGCGHINEV